MKIDIHVPVRVISVLNTRMHWRRKWSVSSSQRDTTRLLLLSAINRIAGATASLKAASRIRVKFTRYYKSQKMDKHDNLNAAFKAVRDALAGVVGIDDGSDAYSFEYDQEKSPKIGFRIEMEW